MYYMIIPISTISHLDMKHDCFTNSFFTSITIDIYVFAKTYSQTSSYVTDINVYNNTHTQYSSS